MVSSVDSPGAVVARALGVRHGVVVRAEYHDRGVVRGLRVARR